MKLGFICLNAPCHINSMTTLARRLQGRNHEVVFLYQSEAAGLPCVPGPENNQFLDNRRGVSKMQGDGVLEKPTTLEDSPIRSHSKHLTPTRRVTMTIISGPVDHYPEARQSTAACSTSLIDFFEAGRQPSWESEEIGKEAALENGHRQAVYWLISLATIISLLVGALLLLESGTPRATGTDQLELAAEGAPSHVEVTFGEAIRALGVQH
jgi:hypothetical protein